ncbi:carboxymuconolactone decarboxylase family protein [Tomitella biformata]|uniref:carboxymuconolactone decarboxylase family protein n=1 Tax=Tomitella biformata TaxID=630403 RepID=UPI000463D5A6|nr:carboxymuconolactone decarboxylase family protein [Tomitella biformata]
MSGTSISAQWAEPASAALGRLAPGPAGTLALLAGSVSASGGDLAGLARAVCAETLGLTPLPTPTSAAAVDPAIAEVAAAFAEQFSQDVSAITPAERAALSAALGEGAREFVLSVYVADWAPRVRRALEALFAPTAGDAVVWPESEPTVVASLWPTIEAQMVAIARLSAVDPVTTEVVRLRGARQHNCRLCKSLRQVTALNAGADESTFDAVDHYEDSVLSARQKAALALTDALIWQPAHLSADVLDAVREHFTPAEAVELVLDNARNAFAKVAVSLGTDEANVAEGVQIYEVRPDGTMDFTAEFTPTRD